MIVINFKTYAQVTLNNNGVLLAKICQQVFNQYHIPIILCVQATDIAKISKIVNIPIYAQHIDPIEPGKNTGFISALAIKEAGAAGVMINHSEHRIGDENIRKTIEIAQANDLQTLLCVENAGEAQRLIDIQPDMIALEEPSLIGTGNSIVDNPIGKQKVQECIALQLQTKILVGAGVMNQHDVKASVELGADGVLIASGFDLANDPKAVLEDLCNGYEYL